MSDTAYLALYFDAPLQSWGYASKFDRRTTLAYPTRSGVTGLICAALGVDRADTEGLRRLDTLTVNVYAFRMGGRLTDYHTVGGGYNPKTEKQKICRRASGGTGDTVQTWREYLEGSRFGVVVSGDAALLAELAAAVQDPKWGVWLGRKACVPASRLYEGVFGNEEDAKAALCRVSKAEGIVRTISEAADFAGGNDTVMDRPLDFAKRRFAPRRITVE